MVLGSKSTETVPVSQNNIKGEDADVKAKEEDQQPLLPSEDKSKEKPSKKKMKGSSEGKRDTPDDDEV